MEKLVKQKAKIVILQVMDIMPTATENDLYHRMYAELFHGRRH
jgi:hypothetical protein